MLSNCGAGEDSWGSFGQQRDQTSQSWRKSVLHIHWKDWCWSLGFNTLATWCKEPTHWKRPLTLEETEGRRRRGQQSMRGLDDITEANSSMNVNLSKLGEMVKNREAWRAASMGVTKSRTWPSNQTTTVVPWWPRPALTLGESAATAFPAHMTCVQLRGLGCRAASVSWFVILFPIEHLEPFSTHTPQLVPHTQGSPFSEPLDSRGYWAYVPMSLPGDFKCNNPPNQIRFVLGAEILPGIFDTWFGPLSSRISPKMVSLYCTLDLVAPLSPPAYCIHHSIWLTAHLHAAYFQMIRAVCFQSLLKTGYPLLSSGLSKLL